MSQHAGRMCLIKKHLSVTLTGFLVLQRFRHGYLDCYFPVAVGIIAFVYDPHTALSNLFMDIVFAQFFRYFT